MWPNRNKLRADVKCSRSSILKISNLQVENTQVSFFKPEREAGDQVLSVDAIAVANEEGDQILKNVSFTVNKGDKIAFISKNPLALTLFFKCLGDDLQADKGEINWGVTIQRSYLPNDNSSYFKSTLSLVDWLRQYSEEKDETFIRGFLGRMLFSGEESLKKCKCLEWWRKSEMHVK